jgi:predicted lysophospholipase L1 biosynthesis ABC-type transport system permease subunit
VSSDPLQKLRRLVPWLFAAIVLQVGCFLYVVMTHELPAIWPILVGDIVFTLVVVVLLWRWLGRRPRG